MTERPVVAERGQAQAQRRDHPKRTRPLQAAGRGSVPSESRRANLAVEVSPVAPPGSAVGIDLTPIATKSHTGQYLVVAGSVIAAIGVLGLVFGWGTLP